MINRQTLIKEIELPPAAALVLVDLPGNDIIMTRIARAAPRHITKQH